MMMGIITKLTSKVFQQPSLTMSDFYHSFHNNYMDMNLSKKKIEKDYFIRDNFFFEHINGSIPKTRNWVSKISAEYHWMQNVSTSYPAGVVDLLVFGPTLFKLGILQENISSEMPYTCKYIIGFFDKPSEWKIKTSIFAIENMKPFLEVYEKGVFYLNLNDYSVHFIPVDYKREEMIHKKNKILHWKRYHSFYEKNISLFPKWAYPNFSKGEMYDTKIRIGKELGEITLLYYCKDAFRKKCHNAGIYSYKDPDFLSFLKENQSSKRYDIILRILSAQKKIENKWYLIEKNIRDDDNFQKLLDAQTIFYIDFETDAHGNVYLIGILSNEKEFVYMWGNRKVDFIEFLDNNKDALFVYYNAEKKFMKKWFGDDFHENMVENWIDLNPILTTYCAFQDAFDFKLKSIQRAFYQHGILTEKYSEECPDGLKSIELFNEYCDTKNEKIKTDLIHYNYLDCLFTKDIAEFIYKNYE